MSKIFSFYSSFKDFKFLETMRLRMFQIDAFASGVFSDNPAAVCPLKDWLQNELMQAIAAWRAIL